MANLTDCDFEILAELIYCCDESRYGGNRGTGQAAPLDCGGSNGSDHSYRLTKMSRLGYAEHKQLGAVEWGDVTTRNARGSKVYRPTDMTPDINEAKRFADLVEAWEFWRKQPACKPFRDYGDGGPNRPLTATTWEFVPVGANDA